MSSRLQSIHLSILTFRNDICFAAMGQNPDSILMLIDDEIATLQALERIFKSDFKVLSFQSPDQALAHLHRFQNSDGPAIVLSDFNLPNLSGLDFLAEVRSRWPQTIRCLFSGQMSSLEISQALRNGVIHRFFQKPWDNETLRLHMIECLQLHGFLIQAKNDSLTQLLNRKGLLDQLEIEIERSHRHQRPLALMLLDIDQFKMINDQLGHHAGDLTVIEVAEVLKSTLRNIDLISRYGGDEFIVVLPDTNESAALLIADRIRTKIEALSQRTQTISVSIGISLLGTEKLVGPELIKRADNAMYQAKSLGKNRVCMFKKNA